MKYQQNPVTVVKGSHVVKDVYLADLPAWEADGYEILGQQKDPELTIESPQITSIADLEPTVDLTVEPKKKAAKPTPVESESN